MLSFVEIGQAFIGNIGIFEHGYLSMYIYFRQFNIISPPFEQIWNPFHLRMLKLCAKCGWNFFNFSSLLSLFRHYLILEKSEALPYYLYLWILFTKFWWNRPVFAEIKMKTWNVYWQADMQTDEERHAKVCLWFQLIWSKP